MQLAGSLLFGVFKQEVGLRRMREFWAGLPIGLLAGLFIWLAPAAGGAQPGPLGGQTALIEASASFLPVDEAFSLEYGWVSADVLRVRWVIAQGYYLYKDQIELCRGRIGRYLLCRLESRRWMSSSVKPRCTTRA